MILNLIAVRIVTVELRNWKPLTSPTVSASAYYAL